jgi:signal peptidase I
MKSTIIKSENPSDRNRGIAFLLSFLFTGLGQIYNGNFSKGMIFFIFRILTLLIIPFYAILYKDNFSVLFFLTAIGLHVLTWLICSFESLFTVKSNLSYNLRKYNNIIIYLIYIIVTSGLLFLSFFIICFFFLIDKVQSDMMHPSIIKNDYILINKYSVKEANIGDIVSFISDEKDKMLIGRILARPGDLIKQEKNDIFINDSPLIRGIFSEEELKKTGIKNEENLFYEINNNKKYPVIIKPNDNIKSKSKPVSVKDNELFITYDNRNADSEYFLIDKNKLTGIVHGILYSKNINRIFNKPYILVKNPLF